jgi:hypothetical protein
MITVLPFMVRYQMSSGTATQALRPISGKGSVQKVIEVMGHAGILLLVHRVTRALNASLFLLSSAPWSSWGGHWVL